MFQNIVSQTILSWCKMHLSGLRFAKMHSCKIASTSTQHGWSTLLFEVTDSYQNGDSPLFWLFILTLQLFFCLKDSEIFRLKFWHLILYLISSRFYCEKNNFLFYKFCLCLHFFNFTCNFQFSPAVRNPMFALKM